jgi:predicted DNA-binding transcriptional regulator YafY
MHVHLVLAAAALLAMPPIAATPSPIRPATPDARLAPSETAGLLVKAIHERRVVTFRYGGRARTVEPHTCGIGSTGEEILHGYQTEGESASGAPLGWRSFTVAKISDLIVHERRFSNTRPGFATSRPRLSPSWAEAPLPEEPARD